MEEAGVVTGLLAADEGVSTCKAEKLTVVTPPVLMTTI